MANERQVVRAHLTAAEPSQHVALEAGPVQVPRCNTNEPPLFLFRRFNVCVHGKHIQLPVTRMRTFSVAVPSYAAAVVFPPRRQPVPRTKRHAAREGVPLVLKRGEVTPSCDLLNVHI